jgi:hypothetical protein
VAQHPRHVGFVQEADAGKHEMQRIAAMAFEAGILRELIVPS